MGMGVSNLLELLQVPKFTHFGAREGIWELLESV
jgi:hypothetical protein